MTRHIMGILALLALVLSAGAALAGGSVGTAGGGALLRAEMDILGSAASRAWQSSSAPRAFDQIGGERLDERPDEIGGAGGEREDQETTGPSNLREKIKAGALSAVLPGAGQFINGQRTKAYIMGGAEVAIWTAWFVFDKQGDGHMEDSRDWAAIYAGTSGDHGDRMWQAVGRYMDSDAYWTDLIREARALGETAPGPPPTWQWVNNDRRVGYQGLRADGNSAYDRRDFMILFAVINRAVSVVDAVIGAGGKPGTLETEVLGMGLELGVVPSWQDPGARCAVTRNF
ncbi:MAG: hypothetical protein GY838_12285 [bacterium]|nr:hypothetical protein [bacterium]